MDGTPPISRMLPRPGRVLWAVLGAMTLIGVVTAGAAAWVPGGEALFLSLVFDVAHPLQKPWGLLSSALLTSPKQWSHLLFSLVGIYFLGAPLERRWGGFRFARFLVISALSGNLATLLLDAVLPGAVLDRLHGGDLFFGPAAVIAAIAVA